MHHHSLLRRAGAGYLAFGVASQLALGQPALRQLQRTDDPARAVLRVRVDQPSHYPIPRFITGKFCEHLGANIYNGMEAEILRNPTFADYPFAAGHESPDGVAAFLADEGRIAEEYRRQARRVGWPAAALEEAVAARADGLACWWTRVGSRDAVRVSPDTGPAGGRAQRVAVRTTGEGIAQWTALPLHRVRRFEVAVLARSPDITALSVSLTAPGAATPAAATTLEGLSTAWRELKGSLALPAGLPAAESYRLELTADSPGQLVVAHAFLLPADHQGGADPDVIRFLRASRLPLLRWPGGNFVSGYHWEDGVGPIDHRPTRPNYAWGGVEPNLFGTDEYVAFCRAVGCEPMICINAGNGTPEEAARWIEYCNGPATSPEGARRAANGHPAPYHITHWEVGNELWGRWQYHWTTPAGYVDRYRAFAKAMLAADPELRLYACGAPMFWGPEWNRTVVRGLAPRLPALTDHPLIGGTVSADTDPLAVYRDFMAVPEALEAKWAALGAEMRRAGVGQPRLAVTELQMFAHLGRGARDNREARLTPANLVTPGTLAEGLYDVLIYHAAVRLGPLVELVTHSATVNHGGGLRKERERVYANPCYYAQAAFAEFADATPVAVELATAVEEAPRVLPELRNAVPRLDYGAVDALAALAPDGTLLLSLVHRGSHGPVHLRIELGAFPAGDVAAVRTLGGAVPWAANTLEAPEAVRPVDSTVRVSGGGFDLDLNPYSVLRVGVARKT